MRQTASFLLCLTACTPMVTTVDVPDVDGATNAADASDPFASVRQRLDEAVRDGSVPGYQLVIRDETDVPLLAIAGGDYALAQLLPLDSSIKPVTSLVVHTLVRDGVLDYDTTMGTALGWTGPEAAVTVAQLLSFSSGFAGSSDCLTPPPRLGPTGALVVPPDRATLADCAAQIRAEGLIATPGSEFHYGASHQLILALVADTVTGQRWNELFAARVLAPLGIAESDLRYTNNRVAASAVGHAGAFATVYRAMALDAGILGAGRTPALLPRAQMDRFFADTNRDGGVAIVDSPWMAIGEEVHFGLGIWIRCERWDDGASCLYFGSGGNGTTVWMDPVSRTVSALVLYQGEYVGYQTGYALMNELVPRIRAALGR
jgi:CubicO group peptidase (beta-lactamase class C family)